MNDSTENGGGGFGAGCAEADHRGPRPLGKGLMWQTGSSSYLWSAIVGPAGRRREASFSGGLARSLAQGGQCLSDLAGGRTGAACLREGEICVGVVTAAWGSAGDGEKLEGTDERASQGRCLIPGSESAGDAGDGLASRLR